MNNSFEDTQHNIKDVEQSSSSSPPTSSILDLEENKFYKEEEAHLNNEYLKNGCQVEGHNNLPLLCIFLPDGSLRNNKIYGCIECKKERSNERYLSLLIAVNALPEVEQPIPILDKNIKDKSLDYIELGEEYDSTLIDKNFNKLESNLKKMISMKKEKVLKFVTNLYNLEQQTKQSYMDNRNFKYLIKELLLSEGSEQEISSKLDYLISDIYKNLSEKEDNLNEVVANYEKEYQKYSIILPLKQKGVILDLINRFLLPYNEKDPYEKKSFLLYQNTKQIYSSPENNDLKPTQKQPKNHSKFQILRKEIPDSISKEYYDVQMSFSNIQIRNGIVPFTIQQSENKSVDFSLDLEQNAFFLSQACSMQPLNPSLTYKFLFELIYSRQDKPFLIGLTNFLNSKDTIGYEKTSFQKVFFNSTYKNGMSHVQCGKDLSEILKSSPQKFIFKVCLAKNIFKFTDVKKESINVLTKFVASLPNQQYCLCILSQVPQFKLKLLSSQVKKTLDQ